MKDFKTLAIFHLAAVLCSTATAEADFGEIVANAYIADNGDAIEGVLVAVSAPKYYGRHPTNVDGIIDLKNVPEGAWEIEAHCPSKTIVGREILVKRIRVRAGHTTTFEIPVPNGFCGEPEYSERTL